MNVFSGLYSDPGPGWSAAGEKKDKKSQLRDGSRVLHGPQKRRLCAGFAREGVWVKILEKVVFGGGVETVWRFKCEGQIYGLWQASF